MWKKRINFLCSFFYFNSKNITNGIRCLCILHQITIWVCIFWYSTHLFIYLRVSTLTSVFPTLNTASLSLTRLFLWLDQLTSISFTSHEILTLLNSYSLRNKWKHDPNNLRLFFFFYGQLNFSTDFCSSSHLFFFVGSRLIEMRMELFGVVKEI